ncbi:MAG: hypothetical protein RBS68_00080 [Anaerolineales bacterium]|jgi:hypothetical protein|nr:hypothetical protein [Anaerolineales bacterium]
MKKTIFVVLALVLGLGVLGVGAAFAQSEQPPADQTPAAPLFERGQLRGLIKDGSLHTYRLEAFAAKIGLSVDQVTALVTDGTRLREIALANGVAQADLPAFMQEVHQATLDAAVADGVLTQEQADLIAQRAERRAAGRGDCDGSGSGGRGGRHGGRGGQGGGPNQQP